MGLGVGLGIAATEAQRYSALWQVGATGPAGSLRSAVLLFYLVGFLALYLAARKFGRGFFRNPVLLALLAVLGAAGTAMCSLSSLGIVEPGAAYALVQKLCLEAPYFIMVAYAVFLMEYEARDAMRAVAFGIVVAGGIQILVSLLAATPLAYAVTVVLAPLSCIVLFRLDVSQRKEDEWYASLAGDERSLLGGEGTGAAPAAPGAAPTALLSKTSLVWLMLALIAVSSVVVYIIHSQWVGIQDGGSASLLVQICAGLGVLLAGNILYFVVGTLRRESLPDFCFILILPVAVAALYLVSIVEGATVAVSTIPLNIVYATLLFFVWAVPFLYESSVPGLYLSLAAFFLKRLGILAGGYIVSSAASLGVDSPAVAFVALFILIALDVAYYFAEQFDPRFQKGGPAAASGGLGTSGGSVRDGYMEAIGRIAEQYRLTPREREILVLLGRGRTARYIAGELQMADATVKTHIMHIYRKLGINSQQALLDVVEEQVRSSGLSAW